MKKSRRSRIATQLLVWFLLLTLLPLIAAAFLTTRTARQLLTDQIENNLRAIANNLGRQVEAFLALVFAYPGCPSAMEGDKSSRKCDREGDDAIPSSGRAGCAPS